MPSNNSKYSEEMRERTVLYILNSGKSAKAVAEELGIDTNTVCKWVREYRRKNNLPSPIVAKTIERATRVQDPGDMKRKLREIENRLKQKEKELIEERENVEIMRVNNKLLIWHTIVFVFLVVSIIVYSTVTHCRLSEIDELIWTAAIPLIIHFVVMWFMDIYQFVTIKFLSSILILLVYVGLTLGLIFYEHSFIAVLPENSTDVSIHIGLSVFTFINLVTCINFYQREGWDAFISIHRK